MWYSKNHSTIELGAGRLAQESLFGIVGLVDKAHGVVEAIRSGAPLDGEALSRLSAHIRHLAILQNRLVLNVPVSYYEETYGRDAVRGRNFVNIGAGAWWHHPAWTAVDIELSGEDQGVIADLSLCQPLPFDSGTVKIVYSSHCLEHLAQPAVENVLSEAFRILEPGALVRLAVPDIDRHYRAYAEGDRVYFKHVPDWQNASDHLSVPQMFLEQFAFPCSAASPGTADYHIGDDELAQMFAEEGFEGALDSCIRRFPPESEVTGGGHINWFNLEKLRRMLSAAGFEDVTRSAYGQSRATVLCDTTHFDFTSPEESVYVEAIKPERA